MKTPASGSKASKETEVLSRRSLGAAIASMAKAIKADQKDAASIAIVGIQSRGVPLASPMIVLIASRLIRNTPVKFTASIAFH